MSEENGTAAEQPQNLLWAIDEIIIALRKLRERLAALDKKS